jgi:predicted O-linked N-acetylglucosamine transferase (SPINDLY family)
MGRVSLNQHNHSDSSAPPDSASNKAYGTNLFQRACRKHQQGEINSALQLYQQAVQADPSLHGAWRNLGALLRQQGKTNEARHCTEQALRLDSSDGSLWGNYGNVLRDQGLLEESCKAFQQGMELAPSSLGLLQGLAISLGHRSDYRQVIELLKPVVTRELVNVGQRDNALSELLLELGNAHHALGEKDLALKRWREGTHGSEGEKRLFMGLNIAQVLCEDKQFTEAEQLCKELEPLFPANENLVYAQGVIARGTGDLERASQLFEKALERNPAYPICLNTYGLLLREIGRTHHSRHCFEQALRHDPNFGAAMNNLGSVLKDVARYDEALVWLRKGADALRDNPAAHSNVLFTLVGYELEPADERLAEAERFAERFGQHPFERWRDRIPDPYPKRRLRIGLISPDFCRHAVSYFVEPLLEQWDRQELEITLYPCGEQFDDYSARLQAKADRWVNLRGCSDEACVMQILQDEIDILVDLAGHTAGNRLALFGAKAAPIQATYLGYYGTTGLPQVDYWITDAVLHPPENDGNDPCSEERWRLNRCYVSYRPLPTAPPVQGPPCLKKELITFGSFNQSRKITPRTASHWMGLLSAIPNSKMLLKSKNLGEQVERQRIETLFQEMGLAPERLELRGHSPSLEEHLSAYNDVDIALDTFPYTGCTTTADALWMGVPVLTVAGESMVSRQAAAVLQGAGLNQWICRDEAEMIERALTLANDRNQLKKQRLQQRQQVACSELLDHAGLAASLEGAFRSWWLRWLQQQGWPSEVKQQAWPQTTSPEIRTPLTPVTNSVSRRLTLWLGSLPDEERQRRESHGQRVVPLRNLQPWGEAVSLFTQERPGAVMAWLETGASAETQRWWQHIYPQLVWEPEGPLTVP